MEGRGFKNSSPPGVGGDVLSERNPPTVPIEYYGSALGSVELYRFVLETHLPPLVTPIRRAMSIYFPLFPR